MLRPEDRRAIEDLFERLANVERNSGPRDADAERLILQRLRENPAASYYMAQTIIVQEAALRDAQKRIEAAEQPKRQGGFLDEIFGDDRPEPPRRHSPWGPIDDGRTVERRGGGSGFLAGAAQTALGVTGGVLLGSAIAGMFSSGAQATETAVEPDPAADEPGQDDGGDWGNWGDFDIGGEF